MAYQVIARKYRPQRFADVVGQEHVTQTLSNAISQNRIAHAYLFVGPRGTGKTTIARIFAKCLNCTDGPKVDFPADDPRAREITEGRSMDVLEIDGASNRGIDEVRELRETVKYAPASSRFKIYIIDEVHMLTKEAFNALLKTLEEPPAHVKFMFATTEPEKILPTILSRCQRFDLRRIPTALIVSHLAGIARQENVQIGDAALHAIARGADGGMRDAESTLDQLISFCGAEIAEADVLSMFGLAARGQILALAEAVLSGETEKALRLLNDLAQQGKDLGRLVSELLAHFRNLLIFVVSRGDLSLIEASESEAVDIKEQSARVHPDALMRMLEVLTDCEGSLRDATSRKILLEVTLLKMIEARSAVSIDTILKQVQQMRADASGGAPRTALAAVAVAAPKAVVAPAPVSRTISASAATMSPSVPAADLSELWKQVVEAVSRTNKILGASLDKAHPVSLLNDLFTIGFDPEHAHQLSLVDNPEKHKLLQDKLAELGRSSARIRFIKAEAPASMRAAVPASETAPTTPPSVPATASVAPQKPSPQTEAAVKAAPAPFNKDEFKNDPLIRKALEIFKGQIVDVGS